MELSCGTFTVNGFPPTPSQKGARMNVKLLPSTLVLAAFGTMSFAASAEDATGAGASFPAPIYAKWADAYNKATGARINYQSIGSGAGIKQNKGKTADFGASAMALP